jgi:CHAD domain-containing protein
VIQLPPINPEEAAPSPPFLDDIEAPPLLILEFTLDGDELGRLSRLPIVQKHRAGRTRSVPRQIIWHDNAARELAARGLVVAQSRGNFALEQVRPQDEQSWLPCMPAPKIAEAAAIGALPAMPEGLVALAGFAGTERLIKLKYGPHNVDLTVLDGVVRGVAQEWPEARLRLAGPREACLAIVAHLAGDIALIPPRGSMAACALARIAGQDVKPRHLGAPKIAADATLDEAMAGICAWLADVLGYWAPLAPRGEVMEPVHQMRVASRRLRSALSLFRRAPGGEVFAPYLAPLRDLAATLGQARDWDVFLNGTGAEIGAVFADDPRISAMLLAAARRRKEAYTALGQSLSGEAYRRAHLALALLAVAAPWRLAADEASRPLLDEPAAGFAAACLTRLARHVFVSGGDFDDLSAEALHDLRKDAKRLRYACDGFAPLFPGKGQRKFVERLATLQECLGEVNDSHVAASLMAALPGGAERQFAAGVVQGFVAHLSRKARAESREAWRKLRREAYFWA